MSEFTDDESISIGTRKFVGQLTQARNNANFWWEKHCPMPPI